jgi:hypothetical protein
MSTASEPRPSADPDAGRGKAKGRSPASTEESGPLVGTFKGGAGHRWRDGRPLDHNSGIGPRVMIVRRNIVELALDFHGDERVQSPSMDWTHVATFLAQRRGPDLEPRPHHADDR